MRAFAVSRVAGVLVAGLVLAVPSAAANPSCRPCAGLLSPDAAALAALVAAEARLDGESVLFAGAVVPAAVGSAPGLEALAAVGASPWLTVEFATPAPLLEHLGELQQELGGLARLVRSAGPGVAVEILWPGRADPDEYAYLLKRASVAVAGVDSEALLAAAVPPEPSSVRSLYALDVGAYVDAVAVRTIDEQELAALSDLLAELDPGALLVATDVSVPEEPSVALAEAARLAEAGVDITLFAGGDRDAEVVPVLVTLAREFSGDLAFDPYSRPAGGDGAWSFVRGSDLGVRVIARREAESLVLDFSDPGLRDPVLVDAVTGARMPQWGIRRSSEGLEVELVAPSEVVILALERMTAGELEGELGLEEELTVEDMRQMPVEEIVRRLQAFEDAQSRRLETYSATNTTHLRFQGGTAAQSVEATFEGSFFFRQGAASDWAWERFLVNGIEWRGQTIPEIPLIQPEKAAALPAEITFGKEYRYALRGTETVAGRDCWVVDFEPGALPEAGRSLYQGTVWVDREIFARVRTRAVQLGLEGEVVSNEETISFSPVDAAGNAAPWSRSSFILPLRVVGQQLWSVLNATPVVEREVLLTELEINAPDFEQQRAAVLASEVTMVRDTERGLRYLVFDEEAGERVEKEGFDTNRRFLVGGVFFDEAMDFPIPLGGFNWLWFDWRGTGTQANVFFGGALLTVGVTDPDFLGSKFDAGIDMFALAVQGSDQVFRAGREQPEEEIETSNPNVDLKLGRPFGNFFKLDMQYQLGYRTFSRSDDTAEAFVLPRDHLNHTLSLIARYSRRGYRLRLRGNYHARGDWEPWGLPGNGDYDPKHDDYLTWSAGVAKTWHLPKFLKFGAAIEYVGGRDLDRFSKYDFGFFSDVTVHGYQSNKVRAEEALAARLTYGFDVANLFRLDLVGDAAWATDQSAGFEREMLAGLGLVGTVLGPWQTVVNADIGVAVAGPDDGFTAFVAFLKLFD